MKPIARVISSGTDGAGGVGVAVGWDGPFGCERSDLRAEPQATRAAVMTRHNNGFRIERIVFLIIFLITM